MVIRRGLVFLLLTSVFTVLSVSQSLSAGEKTPPGLEVTLNFQNVELVDMIGTISELTGKNFVYDESIRGKVSIVSPKPVTVDEAYRLFSTVLRVKGFTIVPAGKVNKIVSIRTAKEESLPISSGKGLGEQFITRLIELQNLDATVVADTILRPLMPKTSYVVAHAPTNTVVITDSAANIRRLSQILATLDRSWEDERMEIVPLQFADAEETAKLVMQIFEGGATVRVRGAKPGTTVQKKTRGQVFPYERTNMLMLLGDEKFISRAKELVFQLDEKADMGRSVVHVYYLENAQAETLSETLNKIISGTKKQQAAKQKSQPDLEFGDITITPDLPTNALIITATMEDYQQVENLILDLDIKRKQVFVEVLILELSMDALMDLGVALKGALDVGDDSIIFGASNTGRDSSDSDDGDASLLTKAVDGILLGGMFNPITTMVNGEEVTVPSLSVLIGLSETDTNINVLSAPRLLTSDNEEAEIIVGENVPIITSRTTDNSGNLVNSIDRQDAALTLRFTPQITEGDLVRLKVFLEITQVTDSVGTVDLVGPTFKKKLLTNSILARDGETVVLGGLFQTDKITSVRKVPFLGDIPGLGFLFKRTQNKERKTSLLMFITPRVIRNSEDLKQITSDDQRNFDRYQEEDGTNKFFNLGDSEGILLMPEGAKEDY
ncbi:MAG: type II secretion system protein GspD [Deltaproteobacteria bacterium]|nr:MAG: type II secretion system protein GspD [Deltaproteobacteria bacterium]